MIAKLGPIRYCEMVLTSWDRGMSDCAVRPVRFLYWLNLSQVPERLDSRVGDRSHPCVRVCKASRGPATTSARQTIQSLRSLPEWEPEPAKWETRPYLIEGREHRCDDSSVWVDALISP